MSADPDAVLAAVQGQGKLPSVTAAVARTGSEAWVGAAGAESDPDRVYRIGSITKTMTAVLVLQLRDEGLLDLDDRVGGLLPEAGYGDATLRGLLSHTAGMQSEPVGSWWERSPGVDVPTLLAANDGAGRVAGAGEYYHYSNLGYALLGEIAARLRGRSWWHLVQERLLTPLGMTATTYLPPADCAPGRSVDHFTGRLTPEPHADTVAMAPAGQLWSNVRDLLKWADFLAVGHPDVLLSSTLEEMADPVPPADGYGLGLRCVPMRDRTLVGHTGSMPGFQACLFVDRQSRDAVAVLANATTGLRPERLPGLFLGDGPVPECDPWAPTASVPAEVEPVLGLWFWGNTGESFEWSNEELVVRDLRSGEVDYRFGLVDGRLMGTAGYHRGERLDVVRRADGSVSHLECATFVYTRTPYDPEAPIPGGHPRPS